MRIELFICLYDSIGYNIGIFAMSAMGRKRTSPIYLRGRLQASHPIDWRTTSAQPNNVEPLAH